MSITARYEDGVFKPLGNVEGASQGKVYRVFSEEELLSLKDNMGWLKAAEPSFAFWDNDDDAIFDSV